MSMRQQIIATRVRDALERLGDDFLHPPQVLATEAGVAPGQLDGAIRFLRRSRPDKVIIGLTGPGGGYLMTDKEGWIADYNRQVLGGANTRLLILEANLSETLLRSRSEQQARTLMETMQRMAQEISDLLPALAVNSTA